MYLAALLSSLPCFSGTKSCYELGYKGFVTDRTWNLETGFSQCALGDSRCHERGCARALEHGWAIKDARYCPGQQPALLWFGVAAIGMSLVVASGQKAEIQRAGCLCLLVLLPLLFLELFIVLVSFLFLGGFHNLR